MARSAVSVNDISPKKSIAEFVYDAGVLEGNPFTYPEVQTLLEGITVGGRMLADQQQIHNLGEAANKLFKLVHDGEFRVEKPVSDELHRLVAKGEALDPGHFRGEGDPPEPDRLAKRLPGPGRAALAAAHEGGRA